MFSRRDFLYRTSAGLGSLALSALLGREEARAGILSPKAPHHPAKAILLRQSLPRSLTNVPAAWDSSPVAKLSSDR